MQKSEATVLRMLKEAANAGHPCPKNAIIARAIGLRSDAVGTRILRKLESLGHIQIRHGHDNRVVRVVETGKCTASPKGFSFGPPATAPAPRQVVRRDPCPRCAVRADVGCAHGWVA